MSAIQESNETLEDLRKILDRLKFMLYSSPATIYAAEPRNDYAATFVSENVKNRLGYEPHEFIEDPKFWVSHIHPEDKIQILANLPFLFEHDYYQHEYRFRHKDGTYRWMLDEMKLIRDEKGRPLEIVGHWTDITERKRIEEALKESEARYKTVVEDQTEVISRFLPDGTHTFVNDVYCRFFGKSKEELIGKKWFPEAYPDDVDIIQSKLSKMTRSNPVIIIENRVISGKGELRWMQFVNRGFYNQAGNLCEIQSVGRDITEQMRFEQDLRDSEEKYRILFENSIDAILLTSPDGLIHAANSAACKIFGRTEEEICRNGRNGVVDLCDPRLPMALEERERTGKFFGELTFLRNNGTKFPGEISTIIFSDSHGNKRTSMIIRDITESKKSQESLRLANIYNRSLIEVSLDPLVTINPNGQITDVNHATENVTGYSHAQLIGTDFADYFTEPDKARAGYQQVFRNGVVQDYPLELKHRNGSITSVLYNASTYCDESGKVIGVFAAARDITKQKRAEKALIKYTNRLIILHALDRSILTSQSMDEIAQNSLKYIGKLIPYNRASVATFDVETGLAELLVVDISRSTKLGIGAKIPLEIFGEIEKLKQGKIHIVEDLQSLPQTSPIIKIFLEEGIRSYVFIPLRYKQNLIGSLNLGFNSPGKLTSEDNEIAREVADLLTIALQQAMLFRDVNEHRERLLALSHRLTEAEEEERKKLTRELHDKVGQNLTALSINMNIMNNMLSPESKIRIESHLNDSQNILEEITVHIRDVMADLRPVILDEYGLISAIHWYCDRFSKRNGIAVKVYSYDLKPPLPSIVETALFRITEELLTNISKHASAHQVTVTLNEITGKIQLSVADDGVGFDQTMLKNNFKQIKGWGLINARERIESIGGYLSIKSSPGKGTNVIIEVKR